MQHTDQCYLHGSGSANSVESEKRPTVTPETEWKQVPSFTKTRKINSPTMAHTTTLPPNYRQPHFLLHYRTLLVASFILLPLLGLIWAFGILTVNANSTVFAWLFTIFNSLQVYPHLVASMVSVIMIFTAGHVHLFLLCGSKWQGLFYLTNVIHLLDIN